MTLKGNEIKTWWQLSQTCASAMVLLHADYAAAGFVAETNFGFQAADCSNKASGKIARRSFCDRFLDNKARRSMPA